MLIMSMLSGLSFILITYYILDIKVFESGLRNAIDTISFIFLAISTVVALILFSSTYLSRKSFSNESNYSRTQIQIKELKSAIEETFENQDTEEIKKSLISNFKKITNQEIVSEIKNSLKIEEQKDYLKKISTSSINRISKTIYDLSNRANLNLILGITTAAIGILALFYFVFTLPKVDNLDAFFFEYIPRISVVIIIEIFSYFFLKLYKSSLAEIKYFENEVTNLEQSRIALELCNKTQNEKMIEKVIDKFISTERNPILSKEQITKEILEMKTDQDVISTDQVVKIIEALKP